MAELILVSIIIAAVAAYAVFGGADFGAGIWEVNTALNPDERDKRLLYRAIGPVWEANHVWLIFAMMVMWSAFPKPFAAICERAAVPLALALVGIVFRGAAYAFRSSLVDLAGHRRAWEIVFAIASTAAPFFFGCVIGVLADDRPILSSEADGWSPWAWVSFESLFFGFFAVGICSFVASVFLVREAAVRQPDLEERWRTRALRMGWIVGGMSLAGLIVAATRMETVWAGLLSRGWPAVLVAIISGVATIGSVSRRRYWLASFTAACTVTMVLVGGTLTRNLSPGSGVPENVQWLLIQCIAGGLILLAPPLVWLFYLFKSQPQE